MSFYLCEIPRVVKFIKTKYNGGYKGLGKEMNGGGCCIMGIEFQFCKMKRVLEFKCITM